MGSRETGRQSAEYTEKKAKAKQTDRRQVDSSRLTGSNVVRQAGMQARRWLACGRQAACKQAFRSTRSRTASMKQ